MKPLRIKPHDAPRKPQTKDQQRATMRNFHIMRLRGLWSLAYILSPARREAVQAIIDADLRELGAQPQGERHALHMAAFEAETRRRLAADRETEIPF